MRKVLDDETTAATDTNYIVDSSAGTVTGISQKVLVDKTDKSEAPDGEPVDLAFSDDEQKTILAATDAAVQAVLDARTTAAAPAAEDTQS